MLIFCSVRANAQVPNKALGDNMVQVDVIAGVPVFAIYSGDIDQDGIVDAFDFLPMDIDIQNFGSGYLVTDLNGDGITDAFDFLVMDPNIQNFVAAVRPY